MKIKLPIEKFYSEKKKIIKLFNNNFQLRILVRGLQKRFINQIEMMKLNDFIHADFVEFYTKFNEGFRYIFVLMNVSRKFVWAQVVKR